jgi:putative thioredoxin
MSIAMSSRDPQPAAAPLTFDVVDADFEDAVIRRSLEVPVLLDCWATWCGPCRQLGPVLEKLVQDYGGRFVLAKLDADAAPQVAALLGLRSIPHVLLFSGGQPVDEFTGALPEAQVRAFLDRHLGAAGPGVRELAREADAETAIAMLGQALAETPHDVDIGMDLVERLLDAGRHDEAVAVLDRVPAELGGERHAALRAQIAFATQPAAGDDAPLRARIAADPRDLDARFDLGVLLAQRGDFEAAFDALLEVVLRDKGEARERARARMVELFALCRDKAVVDRARRYLGMYLN